MSKPDTTNRPSWTLGYHHAKAGLVASMITRFPDDIDWGEYHVGYAIGARDKRSNDLMDELEATNDAKL